MSRNAVFATYTIERNMATHSQIVQRKQERRYLMLLKLWEAVDGKEYVTVDFMEVAQKAGVAEDEAEEIYNYLWGEEMFGDRRPTWLVQLSHRAIVEIEQSLNYPERGTSHFPSTVIQNFNAPVGSVHTGPNSSSNVTQHFGANVSEVVGLLNQLRSDFQSFPPEQKEEALEVVDALEEEIQSPTPRKGKIRAFLGQLATFTANTASSVAAEAIAKSLGM
jgi:hypothetical protein